MIRHIDMPTVNPPLVWGEKTIVQQSDLLSEDVTALARFLLGKIIVSNTGSLQTAGKIVETEAYRGPDDKACHAYLNKKTPRTRSMFLAGGHAYVYTCYGMHPMLNVVTGPEGAAHAVLIRAIEPLAGIDVMQERRKIPIARSLTNGPGKLANALGIHKEIDGTLLTDLNGHVSLHYPENKAIDKPIFSGQRVGMSRHTGPCALRPWRFYIENNPWVSRPLHIDYSSWF
jgi:DNA-3-methyladenine glycosylase